MKHVLALVLVLLVTAPVLDASRRKGALVRPEFYLLVAVYLYGTFGYATQLIYSHGDFDFMIPVMRLPVHVSYLYTACAVFAIYIGGGFFRTAEIGNRTTYDKDRMLTVLAFAGCVTALAFNLYYFYSFGLFSSGFDRVVFIDEFGTSEGFKFPYMALLLASLPILALNERWPVSPFVVLAFALLHLPIGDRRVVLAVLIVTFVAKLLRGTRFNKKVLLAALAVIFFVGVLVGTTRDLGLSAFSEQLTFGRVFLALSEFSRPFVTLIYYADYGYTPLYGGGLVQAFTNIIPGFVNPFGKFPSPGQQFVGTVENLSLFQGRVSGYGFYPVTEALLNFGPFGIPIFFLVFTLLVRGLSSFALAKGVAFVVPVLCVAMVSFGRSPLSDMLATHVWVILIGLGIYLTARLAEKVPGISKYVGERSEVEPEKLSDAARREGSTGSWIMRLLGPFHLLRRNSLLLTLLTAGISALVATLMVFVPPWYQKEFTISVTPVLTDLQKNLGQTEAAVPEVSSASAPQFLRKEELEGVEAATDYNPETQQAQVLVEAQSTETLEQVDAEVIGLVESAFAAEYENEIGPVLEVTLSNLEVGVEDRKRELAQIEQEIDQFSLDQTKTQNAGEELLNLQARRVAAVAALDQAESLRDYLAQAQSGLPGSAPDAVSANIVDTSEIREPIFSSASVILLAGVLGLEAAISIVLRLGNSK